MVLKAITQTTTAFAAALALSLSFAAIPVAPVNAQTVGTFDPDQAFENAQDTVEERSQDTGAIDADLVQPEIATQPSVAPPIKSDLPNPGDTPVTQEVPDASKADPSVFDDEFASYNESSAEAEPVPDDPSVADAGEVPTDVDSKTYGEDDLIGAAEGVFGKGAEGLAKMIEDLLKEQGEPNGYIVGREAGGAFIVGARYGSGTLFHKVEGERKVYWTGPSIGFDAGASAARTFVLVYNLFDTEDLFERFPAGEGQAYLIGGMHASYMRKGDVVLIPIRLGAGVRLGVNAGYMKFSKKQRWLPF